tara:strand:+ start:1136 stop:2041 length:906 start_codon:yes stop_codon:yes gene_type:complete
MNKKCEVIFVDLKNHQNYILDNIKNLFLFENTNITVITEPELFNNYESVKDSIQIVNANDLDLHYFDKNNKQNEKFRNGFWPLTSRRLFCVYEYMKKYDKKNCFHLENDVLIYTNLTKLAETLKKDKLYITMDAPGRCIAGIMFIPRCFNLGPLIENYMFNKNDMLNLVHFYIKYPTMCETFPIIKTNIHYNPAPNTFTKNEILFEGIFDAAAMGQYLGGVDPRNKRGDTRGFVNETCVVDYSKYKFAWIRKGELYVPHIKIKDSFIPVYNLHIHCKNLKNFMADEPKETKYIELHKTADE